MLQTETDRQKYVFPADPTLRVLTAGSVDDGKSTLLGRLIVDSSQLFDDHFAALQRDSRRYGSAGKELDYSLIVDGLRAEREQGITIDVAYRYVSIATRRLILADCPGHAQYTRNMATGASTADLALVLVDINNGITEQTRRHACVATLLGVPQLVVIANKMDMVDYAPAPYQQLVEDVARLQTALPRASSPAGREPPADVVVVPVSALRGDNVVDRSRRMPWYEGQTVLEVLQRAHPAAPATSGLRLAVQHVIRRDSSYRGYGGRIASATLRPGDEVVILPGGQRTHVTAVAIGPEPVGEASAPLSVSLTLADDVDVTRGDVISAVHDQPLVTDTITADIVWMIDTPLCVDQRYRFKLATSNVNAEVTRLSWRYDLASFRPADANQLALNDIGRITLQLDRPLPVDPYTHCRALGSFILIDPLTNATAGAGMVR